MALETVVTTFDLSDYFGADFDARRTKAWATTNAPDDTIHDTSTGETRIGGAYATVASDGTGSFSHWAPGASANPLTWQTTYHFDAPDRTASTGRKKVDVGPFTVTSSGAITALVEEQVATPTATAADYAALAAAAAAAAVDISGISTSDAVVQALVKNTGGAGPLTSAALLAVVASLKAWAKNPDQLVAGAVTYTSGLLSSAVVAWPDGLPGVLTITSRQASTDAVTGYTITRVDGGTTTTYTQPTITRDTSGAATLVPQITVA